MEISYTMRGFALLGFTDSAGIKCSLQESSAIGPMIWLGCDDANPKILVPGEGWKAYDLAPGTLVTTRMHLSQDQVKALLPALIHFAETGEVQLVDVDNVLLSKERQEKIKDLINAGQIASNVCHSIKQDPTQEQQTRGSAKMAQEDWDRALSAWYHKPSKLKTA